MVAECFGRKFSLDKNNYIENSDILWILSATEIFRLGTLIIDDIEDGSTKRRGIDCSHITHGLDLAINIGNFCYFIPM